MEKERDHALDGLLPGIERSPERGECAVCGGTMREGEPRVEDPKGLHHVGCYARRKDTPTDPLDPLDSSGATCLEETALREQD